MIPPAPGYLRGLRELTERYDILLLLDEIVTLRLSSGGMQEIEGIVPDMTALAKVIGGGFPIGAFGGRKDIMQHFDPDRYADFIQHSGTFNGNNICAIAGLAAMRKLDQAAIDRINGLGQMLQDGINQRFRSLGIRARCHGYGSLQQIQWTDEPIVTLSDVRRANQDIGKSAELLHLEMLNRGLHSSTRCMFNISTPTQAADIDLALDGIGAALETLRPYFREAAPRLLH
jgi:glutamate-1-semialdehyde 2,1-aminomutase